jgi:hypothetical protein
LRGFESRCGGKSEGIVGRHFTYPQFRESEPVSVCGNFNILAGRAILPQGSDDTEFHLIGLSNGLGNSAL